MFVFIIMTPQAATDELAEHLLALFAWGGMVDQLLGWQFRPDSAGFRKKIGFL